MDPAAVVRKEATLLFSSARSAFFIILSLESPIVPFGYVALNGGRYISHQRIRRRGSIPL